MDSLTVLHQAIPNVGVIGSGTHRSLIQAQNPQKLACVSGNGSLESNNSSRSSTSGEEGFISGSSSAEEISYIDQLTTQVDGMSLGIIGKSNTTNLLNGVNDGVYSALMDSSAPKFLSNLNNAVIFGNSNVNTFTDRMKEDNSASLLAAYQNQLANLNQPLNLQQPNANLGAPYLGFNQNQPRQMPLPGAWFYENTIDEPGSGSASTGLPGECSPLAEELNDDYQYATFRAALNNPFTVDEHVEVPSSEHVAEIVGRQGCKIKALRAKTNTYIKTPSRNEPPVFKITGRPEDVVDAKREIECAAEHFTQIRASRRHSQGGNPIPGHVTAYVRVPLRVVGLVVGPKGATIKRIQQDTHTYIITPSREREPIFEVTGLPENVASARREIEQHIYQRTGNMPITDPNTTVNDYDLLAAAHAAAVSQVHNNPNRPNYGALATGTHLRRASAALEAALGFQRAPNSTNDPLNDLVRGMPSLPKAYSNSVTPPMAASNNMYSYYHSNDMPSMNSAVAAALLRSASNEYHTTGNYQTSSLSGNGVQSGNSIFDLLSSVDSISKMNAHAKGFDQLMGNNNFCNLYASKSASRDEGLGDSPTVSMGKLNADPYHLMSSIWSDLDANNGCENPSAFQLARA